MADPSDPTDAGNPDSPFYQNPDWAPPEGYVYNGWVWKNGQPTLDPTNTPGTPGYDPNAPSLHQPINPNFQQQVQGAEQQVRDNITGGAPPTGGSGGGGTSGPAGPNLTSPFPIGAPGVPQPIGQPGFVQPGAPVNYKPPPPLALKPWQAPSIDQALNDPGYQFRTQEGQRQLQNWAGARGTLNDSSTAKALQDYGQQSASQEYQNVWNRDFGAWQGQNAADLQNYNTNYQTQYTDPYAISAGQASAQNAFNLTNTQQANAATQTNYQDEFQKWLAQFGVFQDQRDSTWNKNFQYATA